MSDNLTLAVLQEVADFLEDYSDVMDGDDGAPAPNKAMSLLGEVEREIDRLERSSSSATNYSQGSKT